MLSTKPADIKYNFLSFWYGLTWDWTLYPNSPKKTLTSTTMLGQLKNSRGEVANLLDCDTVASEFELQSRYYTHFWTNTL